MNSDRAMNSARCAQPRIKPRDRQAVAFDRAGRRATDLVACAVAEAHREQRADERQHDQDRMPKIEARDGGAAGAWGMLFIGRSRSGWTAKA